MVQDWSKGSHKCTLEFLSQPDLKRHIMYAMIHMRLSESDMWFNMLNSVEHWYVTEKPAS